ncbi:hypothetical protein T4A_8803 [Trichinella pseudospiralis]|uniref:Uncharacterized protein n=1 Tax=Trichinella pseudospiralis TaxID=6337 RepID=A0A0V1EK40_TRIPS|nr:hypothetical protein T4A_8803 [Trichinella pseudospiralis]
MTTARALVEAYALKMAEKALKVDQGKRDRKEIAQHSTTEQHDDGNRGHENNTTPEQYGHAIVSHETLYNISLHAQLENQIAVYAGRSNTIHVRRFG